MCSTSGLNLTKSISNNRLVLMTIPENHRIEGVKYLYRTLMMAKAKVTPRIFVSISRLELVTAVFAVKISALIKRDLEMKELTGYIWTDIKIVLGYIAKNKKVTTNSANENLHILGISQIQQAERCIIKLI